MKKALGFIAASLLLATPVLAADAPTYNCDYQPSCEVAPGIYGKMSSPVQSKFNMSIGGYVKLDYAYNSVALGAALPAGAPTSQAVLAQNSAGLAKNESILTARQSRLWFKVAGPTFLGAKTGALIEADFYGGGGATNDTSNLRMRHAYGSLDWANTQVLFGQTSDIFGPAVPNMVDFRSGQTTGTPNNPRVPQIRLTQKVPFNAGNSLKLVLGVQEPVQDLAPSSTTGYGAMVNVAAQAMFISTALGQAPGYYGMAMNNLTLGVFGLVGSQKITSNGHAVDVYGYGAYGFIPILKSKDGKSRAMTMSLETQAYIAAGLDMQGATAIATIGTAATPTGAKGYGVYGQAIFYPTQDLGITAGYGRRNILNYASYGSSATREEYGQMIYGNVAYDLNAAVRVATEYEHLKSQFSGYSSGRDTTYANIIRLAAYYFF